MGHDTNMAAGLFWSDEINETKCLGNNKRDRAKL